MAIPRLHPSHTALLVVDVQEKLLPHMHNASAVARQCGRLIDGFNVLGLPILVTEQYRKGLGVTVPELAGKLGSAVCNHEKLRFSACIDPVREALQHRGVRSVVVCGIEAHVCVLQSCLDLADRGYVTALATDAVGSRRASDQAAAVQRLTQAGVLPTSAESCLLELVGEAGTAAFKAMLPVIRDLD
jgi:nicotinamidase-related amidase